MSNLGSISSSQIETSKKETTTKDENIMLTNHEQSIETAKKFLSSSNQQNRTNGLKILIALMSKGCNVSEFAPIVVQEVTSSDPVAKQLCYVYLNHYADEKPETVVLAVNTFQKALTDTDPMTRALAMKVLSSIRSREVLPAVRDAIIQVAGDASPYVKKAASIAMVKAAELDEDESTAEELLPVLERFLNDHHPITFSGAIIAYWSLCPDNIELIHPHFRWICRNIHVFDTWTQVITLRSLNVYSRYCFPPPNNNDNDEGTAAFWDSDISQGENLSNDHILLISSAKKLLQSQSSAVVLAAIILIFDCAPKSHLSSLIRPIIRLIYEPPSTAEITLSIAYEITLRNPHVFLPHFSHFYINKNDNKIIKTLKLKILSKLAVYGQTDTILGELAHYINSNDVVFAAAAVRSLGKIAMNSDDVVAPCFAYLLRAMGRSESQILAEVVVVVAHILRRNRGTDDEVHALRQLCRKFLIVKDAAAKAAVLSIVGDMHQIHPEFAPRLLRKVARNFISEPAVVRLQAITLAAKLIASGENKDVPMYVLKLGERDPEYDVRDRSRILCALAESEYEEIRNKFKTLMFPVRKAPNWMSGEMPNKFMLGSMSHIVGRELDRYEELPDWADESELPDESVRCPKNQNELNLDDDDDNNNNVDNEKKNAMNLNDFFSNDYEEDVYYSEGAEYEIIEEEEEEMA